MNPGQENASAKDSNVRPEPQLKGIPCAVYLLDPGDDARIPSLLRITAAELRKRLDIGPEFNLLKFHTASPRISFLAYPDFDKNPHTAPAESIIVDLISGKIRRDDYRGRENPPILHRKDQPESRIYLAKNSRFPAGSFTGMQSTGTTSPSSVTNTFAGLMSKTA